MIVTIDGPAGAGKSTVARNLAQRLGFRFLDTGAMYRAVALTAVTSDIGWDQPDRLARLAEQSSIQWQGTHVLLNGDDVTEAIRSPEVTEVIHFVADNPVVRRRLVELQRQEALGGNIVTEGRDQGTVAFPDAECKIYLTATAQERARRRVAELAARGIAAVFEDVLAQQTQRDQRDKSREVGRLMRAPDAIEVVTDGMSSDEVVALLEQLVIARQPTASCSANAAEPS